MNFRAAVAVGGGGGGRGVGGGGSGSCGGGWPEWNASCRVASRRVPFTGHRIKCDYSKSADYVVPFLFFSLLSLLSLSFSFHYGLPPHRRPPHHLSVVGGLAVCPTNSCRREIILVHVHFNVPQQSVNNQIVGIKS